MLGVSLDTYDNCDQDFKTFKGLDFGQLGGKKGHLILYKTPLIPCSMDQCIHYLFIDFAVQESGLLR